MNAGIKLEDPKGALALVCVKCTRQGIFPAEDRYEAEKDAATAGWRVRHGKTICPRCPK